MYGFAHHSCVAKRLADTDYLGRISILCRQQHYISSNYVPPFGGWGVCLEYGRNNRRNYGFGYATFGLHRYRNECEWLHGYAYAQCNRQCQPDCDD